MNTQKLAYQELSKAARLIVKKCHKKTLLSPLAACRVLIDGEANGTKLSSLYEAEKYLINED